MTHSRHPGRTRRPFTVMATAVVLVSLAFGAPAALGQPTLSVTFEGHVNRPTPCGEPAFCGPVTLPGYGGAYVTVTPTFLGDFQGQCAPAAAKFVITLDDRSGSLTLLHEGTLCLPGHTELRPSYGNPYAVTGTYVVTGGTGVFDGATGSGDATFAAAGAAWRLTLNGTLVTGR
jgi:hypothetical protein